MTKKKDRELIFNKYKGRCAYCGEELQKGWHVDELLPVVRLWKYKKDENGEYEMDKYGCNIKVNYMEYPERLTIDNQMPSCPSCNINKHSLSLEGFRNLIQNFTTSLNRDSTQYKIAKRYGLIEETQKRVIFYFEKVQESEHWICTCGGFPDCVGERTKDY